MSITESDQNNMNHHQRPEGQPRPARPSRVPAAIAWAAPFALVLAVLLVRNAFLFSTPEYENADMGANSILIEQARRFSLLVGNYSREHFNPPGPAFLYVQAWGESLFYDALHVVPTAWNGQLIALYALNALFAALVVAIGYGWTRSVRGAAGTLAVVGAGFGYAWTAIASKLLTDELSAGSVLVAAIWLATAAASEGIALLSEMSALGRRPATRVAPVMFAVQVVVPVILAPLIFEESWSDTPGGGAGIVASVLFVLAGVIALAGSQAVGAVIDSAHAEE